jgi:hypothetical protein
VLLVVAANAFNNGSDIGALAASTQLLAPDIPIPVLAVGSAEVIVTLEVLFACKADIRILKWLALALFDYSLTAMLINVPWGKALQATRVPDPGDPR